MGIGILVTRDTSLWSKLQVGNIGRIQVALRTQRKQMTTRQGKWEKLMGEIISIRIDPIVTVQTSITERQMVVAHKSDIHLLMAVITDHWIEGGDIFPMTIGAEEIFILSLFLMSFQPIPGDLMREPPPFNHREHRTGPIMLRMTFTAPGSRINYVQLPVN